ncbi:unnamed protein product [Brassica napus]|uniref:(rape) hypothetical protein n=1 Tax=Brassica napus TaxID=3708 RepID=A0A816J9R4_BRANA|nr:unnamed protein product [Brassica napus]
MTVERVEDATVEIELTGSVVPAAAAASTFGVNSCSIYKNLNLNLDLIGESDELHLYLSLSISIPRTSEDLESSLHLKLSLHLELPPSQPLSPSRALSISGSLSVTSCIHLRLSGSPSVTICLHLVLSLFSEENPSPISSPSSLTHLRSHLEALLPISDLISKLSLLRAHLISKLSLLLFSLRGLAVTPFLYLHGSIAGLLRSSQAHSLKLRPSQTHSLLLFLSLFKMSTSKDECPGN